MMQELLFIDDNLTFLSSLTRLLSKQGYRVQAEHNPQRALDELRSRPTQFTAVILDLGIPGFPGQLVAQSIHRIRNDLPVIIITGQEPDQVDRSRTGIREVLQKPFPIAKLIGAIEAVTP